MELVGALFLVLAVALVVILFIARPFLQGLSADEETELDEAQQREHQRSALLAERDRVLTALQELDFDYALGKVPPEDYPLMRAELLQTGADVLRNLDTFESATASSSSVEERIEAAVAARRADAVQGRRAAQGGEQVAVAAAGANGVSSRGDAIEDMIASRKRVRQESAAGFCPKCGKPVQKSDKFCSKCGAIL